MKLENQVCIYEQSKKLTELGVTGDGVFWRWWYTEFDTREGKDHTLMLKTVMQDPTSTKTVSYPAYSVAELGAMMPPFLRDGESVPFEIQKMRSGMFLACYPGEAISSLNTEAITRAEMLIELLNKGLTTADECNKRLLTY